MLRGYRDSSSNRVRRCRDDVGPKRADANVCWCLSYRVPSTENRTLAGPARGERVRRLIDEDGPPGVLAYDGDEVVGWAAVAPRAQTTFARNRKIPHLDDDDVWSVWCIRVRPGHRKQGISHWSASRIPDSEPY